MEEQSLFSIQFAKDKPPRQWYTHCGHHCLRKQSFARSVLDCQLYPVDIPASDHRLLKIMLVIKLAAPKTANRVPPLDYTFLTDAQTAELVESDICTAIGHTPSYTQFIVAAETAYKNHLLVKPRFACFRPWLDSDIIAAQKCVYIRSQRTSKEARTSDLRKQTADATRSLAQLYTDKEEAFYASMASEVEQASKDGKHGAA